MDINKHYEFFDPTTAGTVHVIGLGAIGSNVAEQLARLGCEKIHIYDFDTVSSHNIANQNFCHADINQPKVAAVANQIKAINPQASVTEHPEGWQGARLQGHIFMCVDSMDVRRAIVETHRTMMYVKGLYDFRMRLTDAQHFAAFNMKQAGTLAQTMAFSNEEADKHTPVSACNMTLSIIPTVKTIVSLGVANFVNACKDTNSTKTMILCDTFCQFVEAM